MSPPARSLSGSRAALILGLAVSAAVLPWLLSEWELNQAWGFPPGRFLDPHADSPQPQQRQRDVLQCRGTGLGFVGASVDGSAGRVAPASGRRCRCRETGGSPASVGNRNLHLSPGPPGRLERRLGVAGQSRRGNHSEAHLGQPFGHGDQLVRRRGDGRRLALSALPGEATRAGSHRSARRGRAGAAGVPASVPGPASRQLPADAGGAPVPRSRRPGTALPVLRPAARPLRRLQLRHHRTSLSQHLLRQGGSVRSTRSTGPVRCPSSGEMSPLLPTAAVG